MTALPEADTAVSPKPPSLEEVIAIYQHKSNYNVVKAVTATGRDKGVTTTERIPHWAKSLWEPFCLFAEKVEVSPENVAFQKQYNNLLILWANRYSYNFFELNDKMYRDFIKYPAAIGLLNLKKVTKTREAVRKTRDSWGTINPEFIWGPQRGKPKSSVDIAGQVLALLRDQWTRFGRTEYFRKWPSTSDGDAYSRWQKHVGKKTLAEIELNADEWIVDAEFKRGYTGWIADKYTKWFEAFKIMEAMKMPPECRIVGTLCRASVRALWISLGPDTWDLTHITKSTAVHMAEAAVDKLIQETVFPLTVKEKAKRTAGKVIEKLTAKYAGFGDDYFGHEYGMIGDTYSQRNVVPSYSGYGGHSNGMPLAYNNGDYGSEILALSLIMNVVLFMALFCLMCWICAAVCGYYLGYKLKPRKYRIKIPNHDSSESEAINQV